MASFDPEKRDAFIGKLVGDLGAGASAVLVALGDRLVVKEAGFKKFRRAAETPFNFVFEARA